MRPALGCALLLLRATTCASVRLGGTGVARSIVRLTDAASQRPVTLVGTMHYNPRSVDLVRDVISDAALGAVCIELCAARWNSTTASRWSRERSLKRVLSEDEFQVAFETATDCGLRDVVLADQPIETTGRRLLAALLATVRDLVAGPAGWRRVGADLQKLLQQLPTFGAAALDPLVVAGTPLALARYLYVSPAALPFITVSAVALAVAAAVDEATGALPAWEDAVVSALVAVTLGRSVFVALVEERNAVLARNIRNACLCDTPVPSSSQPADEVVAVVGILHLAGVAAALQLGDEAQPL